MESTRRQVLGALAGAGAVLGFGAIARGADHVAAGGTGPVAGHQSGSRPAGVAAEHVVAPLPFAPAALRGISEKLIVSHHDNNYAAAVKNLNKVEAELAHTTKDTPPFVVGGLRQSELLFRNSMIFHELYFGNLGGDGKAAGKIEAALAAQHGTYAQFEATFRAAGMSLGGGSGWMVLEANLHTGALDLAWSNNHTLAGASAVPLLVMDMYEHAYQMDYGAGAAKYVEAFFANVNWEHVNLRFDRALKATAAMKGA